MSDNLEENSREANATYIEEENNSSVMINTFVKVKPNVKLFKP